MCRYNMAIATRYPVPDPQGMSQEKLPKTTNLSLCPSVTDQADDKIVDRPTKGLSELFFTSAC